MNPQIRLPAALITIALAAGLAAKTGVFGSASDQPARAFEVCGAVRSNDVNESRYLAENGAAMTKMMNDMAVGPAGNVDAVLVAMMTPHHQGAIEMAKAVLSYGRNERIKRLAQEIIVTQQQEILAMRVAIGEPLPPSIPSPTQLTAWSASDTR
jgi:hypothetical protein